MSIRPKTQCITYHIPKLAEEKWDNHSFSKDEIPIPWQTCGLWPVYSSYRQLISVYVCRVPFPCETSVFWCTPNVNPCPTRSSPTPSVWNSIVLPPAGDQGIPPTLIKQTYSGVRPSFDLLWWVPSNLWRIRVPPNKTIVPSFSLNVSPVNSGRTKIVQSSVVNYNLRLKSRMWWLRSWLIYKK